MSLEKIINSEKKEDPQKDLHPLQKKFVIGTYAGLRCNVFPYKENQTKKESQATPSPDNKDDIKKLMQDEYSTLRGYLEELRNCQTTFFWSSITATGIILTLAIRFSGIDGTGAADPSSSELTTWVKNLSYPALYFSSLAVLLLICPVWCIWFLKASTLARVAGYLRVLEDLITDRGRANEKYKYIGWENSYFVYRRSILKDREISLRIKGVIRYVIWESIILPPLQVVLLILRFEKPYQYNILSWLSFLCITVTCIFIIGFMLDNANVLEQDFDTIKTNEILWITSIPVFASLFTFLYTSGILVNLTQDNTRSMATREKLWRYLLDVKMFDSENHHSLIKEREEEFQDKEKKEKDIILQSLFKIKKK